MRWLYTQSPNPLKPVPARSSRRHGHWLVNVCSEHTRVVCVCVWVCVCVCVWILSFEVTLPVPLAGEGGPMRSVLLVVPAVRDILISCPPCLAGRPHVSAHRQKRPQLTCHSPVSSPEPTTVSALSLSISRSFSLFLPSSLSFPHFSHHWLDRLISFFPLSSLMESVNGLCEDRIVNANKHTTNGQMSGRNIANVTNGILCRRCCPNTRRMIPFNTFNICFPPFIFFFSLHSFSIHTLPYVILFSSASSCPASLFSLSHCTSLPVNSPPLSLSLPLLYPFSPLSDTGQ